MSSLSLYNKPIDSLVPKFGKILPKNGKDCLQPRLFNTVDKVRVKRYQANFDMQPYSLSEE
jgi:hypothetical protein